MTYNDPQTFTRAHQAQREAHEAFDAQMRRLYPDGPQPVTLPRLSEFGRTCLVFLLLAAIVLAAGLANQGLPIEVQSVDVARGER